MNLKEYCRLLQAEGMIEEYQLFDAETTEVEGLSYCSTQVSPGSLFLCKGISFSEKYLLEALEKGAFAYVSQCKYDVAEHIPYIIVKDMRESIPVLAAGFFDNPQQKLNAVGITGTKGKTTTAYYLEAIYNEWLGERKEAQVAFLSSIEIYDGKERRRSSLTTPEPLELYGHLKNAVDTGKSHVIMEVSSQALKYRRVKGIQFDTGVFLNISEDHISPIEHEDFEDYFSSKLSIFRHTKKAVVNLDSGNSKRVLSAAGMAEQVITFGIKREADVSADCIDIKDHKITFRVTTSRFQEVFALGMSGTFNVENALAAIAVAYANHIPVHCMKKGLEKTKVRGRMETFESKKRDVVVVVDYAHNRLSFEKIFDAVLREYRGYKIISVFGCPGNKALNRRRDLGLIAGLFSRKVYLAPDDPGKEASRSISGEIARYVGMVGCPYEIIDQREAAICRAIDQAEDKSVILVLGKGCEVQQKYGEKNYEYMTDGEVVRRKLEEEEDSFAHAYKQNIG